MKIVITPVTFVLVKRSLMDASVAMKDMRSRVMAALGRDNGDPEWNDQHSKEIQGAC